MSKKNKIHNDNITGNAPVNNVDNKENKSQNTDITPDSTKEQEGTDTEIPDEGGAMDVETAEIALQKKLAEALLVQADLQDKYLRQAAEFDNFRKRTVKEKSELIRNASGNVLEKLLPIIDDFERAIENGQKTGASDAMTEGVTLIYNKLIKTLEAEGLKKIPSKGMPFDTDLHEAIAMIPASDEASKGTIVECTREGYTLNEKVLRVAQVVVAN